MATLRNKRKIAAVSREMPEGNRSSRGQNALDPELTKDYISQVSEEIEGRVTKKLSKEFSKTGKFMGIAPQMIPIPKWGIFIITLANSVAPRQQPTRI